MIWAGIRVFTRLGTLESAVVHKEGKEFWLIEGHMPEVLVVELQVGNEAAGIGGDKQQAPARAQRTVGETNDFYYDFVGQVFDQMGGKDGVKRFFLDGLKIVDHICLDNLHPQTPGLGHTAGIGIDAIGIFARFAEQLDESPHTRTQIKHVLIIGKVVQIKTMEPLLNRRIDTKIAQKGVI